MFKNTSTTIVLMQYEKTDISPFYFSAYFGKSVCLRFPFLSSVRWLGYPLPALMISISYSGNWFLSVPEWRCCFWHRRILPSFSFLPSLLSFFSPLLSLYIDSPLLVGSLPLLSLPLNFSYSFILLSFFLTQAFSSSLFPYPLLLFLFTFIFPLCPILYYCWLSRHLFLFNKGVITIQKVVCAFYHWSAEDIILAQKMAIDVGLETIPIEVNRNFSIDSNKSWIMIISLPQVVETNVNFLGPRFKHWWHLLQ